MMTHIVPRSSLSFQVNKFQEMRESLAKKFSDITKMVNQRKLELDRKIDDLEAEFVNKNKQIEKDSQTLVKLRDYHSQQLSQNSLLGLQENLNKEISEKIQELKNESEKQSQMKMKLYFNIDALKKNINKIDITFIQHDILLPAVKAMIDVCNSTPSPTSSGLTIDLSPTVLPFSTPADARPHVFHATQVVKRPRIDSKEL